MKLTISKHTAYNEQIVAELYDATMLSTAFDLIDQRALEMNKRVLEARAAALRMAITPEQRQLVHQVFEIQAGQREPDVPVSTQEEAQSILRAAGELSAAVNGAAPGL